MTGVIVTGHGNFATGMTSSLRLLAGEQEQLEAVDFTEEDSIDTLTGKIQAAVEKLSECDGIVIYTDLTGGSPFNVSIRMKTEYDGEMEVIGGSNLSAILDGVMSRMTVADVTELAQDSLQEGRDAMVLFMVSEDDEDEFEE